MSSVALAGTWRMTSGPEAVWEVVSDLQRWQEWWPAIQDVRRVEAVGSTDLPVRAALVFEAPRPIGEIRVDVAVDEAAAPERLVVSSTQGSIQGTGTMRIAGGEVTEVRYAFEVRITSLWLRPVATILRAATRGAGTRRLEEAGDRLAALSGGEPRQHEV